MTNAEKFKEIFGMQIDDVYPDSICGCIDHKICIAHICDDKCPAFHFWEREYVSENDKTKEESK